MKFLYVIGTIILLVFLVGCSQRLDGGVVKSESYKVGVIFPLTGQFAFYGEKVLQGVELAEHEFPGIDVIVEDDQGGVDNAAQAALKLITIDRVNALITLRSSISSSVASVAQDREIILLYTSTVNPPAEENPYVFKNFINIGKDCEVLSKMLKGKSGRLLGLNLDSTQECIASFEKEGFDLKPELFGKGDRDFRSALTKIKSADPDFLVLRGDNNIMPIILKQMRELDIKNVQIICPHLTGAGCNVREATVDYPEYFDGALGSDAYTAKTDSLETFNEMFENEFGERPIDISYAIYEDAIILFTTIEACKGLTDCMVEMLHSSEFEGLDGKIRFNDKGVAERKTTIASFYGGEWHPIDLNKL